MADLQTKDWSVRPNQVLAASLEYSPLDTDVKKCLMAVVERELLTPRGLRTLSPKNMNYKGIYKGTQEQRDLAYHQGTVWPWLLEHFCEAYMNLHKESGICFLEGLINGFEPVMTELGMERYRRFLMGILRTGQEVQFHRPLVSPPSSGSLSGMKK